MRDGVSRRVSIIRPIRHEGFVRLNAAVSLARATRKSRVAGSTRRY